MMWYKINNIEYSENFDFFIENQIGITKSNNKYRFFSLLESKTFLIKKCIFGLYEFNEYQLNEICKEIHSSLLNGEYGQGKLVI